MAHTTWAVLLLQADSTGGIIASLEVDHMQLLKAEGPLAAGKLWRRGRTHWESAGAEGRGQSAAEQSAMPEDLDVAWARHKIISDKAGSAILRARGVWRIAALCCGCRQTVYQWQEALERVPGLRGVDSLQPEKSAISEELNLAWARHEVISDNVDEVRAPRLDAGLARAVSASHVCRTVSTCGEAAKLRHQSSASCSVTARLQQTA